MVILLLLGFVGWTTYTSLKTKPFCGSCLLPEDAALGRFSEAEDSDP